MNATPIQQIKGNQPLFLNEPRTAWLIQSGSLALFATHINKGTIEGDRRYLFTSQAKDALFGIPSACDASLGVIAVALEPSEVSPLPLDWVINGRTGEPDSEDRDRYNPLLEPLLPQPQPVALSLLDGWIHKLGQSQGMPKPLRSLVTPQSQYLSLLAGQVFKPLENQVLWVKIQQGHARWMGDPNLRLDAESGFFPLCDHMWLQAEDHLELFAQATSDIRDQDILCGGLAQLHTYYLRCIERIAAEETQRALQRFQERQHLNQQVTQQTIYSLASVLRPQTDGRLPVDSPLLIAAGAVGKALGVAIQPPMQSEDLKRVQEPLEAIARASQLRLRRILLRDGWWLKDGGPILAYTRMDKHPVALLPVSSTRYELFDPIAAGLVDAGPVDNGKGPELTNGAVGTPIAPATRAATKRTVVSEGVAATLDPVAYVFYRPLPDGILNAIDLLKFAFQGRQRDILAILFTGVAATLLGMLVPQATAILVDEAIPYGNSGLLVQMGIGLLAAAFGGATFQLAQSIASMRIETMSDALLQAAVWDRLLKLRTSFFRQYSIGDLSSRVSGISAIRRRLGGTVLQSLFAGFFSLLNLGLLFYYSPPLALLALAVAVVVVTFTIVSGVLLIRKNRPLLELEGEINGVMVQLINGVPKLRIAGGEERAFAYWGQKYAQQLQLQLSTQRLEDAVALFNTVLPVLTTIALFWLVSLLVDPNQPGTGLSIGSFLAFTVAYGIFISGVTSLSNTVIEVLDVIPLWQRSLPILTAQPEVDLNKTDPGRLTGDIYVDHLSFRYREDGPMILDDVTLQAQPGEFIALVGPSGSGKSTVLRLLLGFESPSSGTVYYDGQDLMGLDVAAVRRQLGVVLQNGRINSGSIFENIASGATITMDEAWTAAEMAGFADDVRAMPMQLHTIVSEGGTNLSGGQRQRLIIARALALKPRILFLDEATSALDNRTQAIVSESLDRLNVTRIVIAHRLSTIRHADRIYVLESGRVVQQGSFEELAKQPGLFAQLIQRQMA